MAHTVSVLPTMFGGRKVRGYAMLVTGERVGLVDDRDGVWTVVHVDGRTSEHQTRPLRDLMLIDRDGRVWSPGVPPATLAEALRRAVEDATLDSLPWEAAGGLEHDPLLGYHDHPLLKLLCEVQEALADVVKTFAPRLNEWDVADPV